ncbi:hypothetical protein ACU635_13875 [[Actinomadura] parvosata]|uniref:hypothetical protein n=1 Tax=[Actinomadura] parvosata TaxID=1955412 RepID=UPI00406C6267
MRSSPINGRPAAAKRARHSGERASTAGMQFTNAHPASMAACAYSSAARWAPVGRKLSTTWLPVSRRWAATAAGVAPPLGSISSDEPGPTPSARMPSVTGTPRYGTSANLRALFGAVRMACDRSWPSLARPTSKAAVKRTWETAYPAQTGFGRPGASPSR